MHSLAKLSALLLISAACPAFATIGYSVIAADPGPWPQILSSVGFTAEAATSAGIYVARPGAPASPHWAAKLESGAVLILEGESPLAATFGFRSTKQTIQLASMEDVHQPKLPLILQRPIEISRFAIPASARVFTKERWTSAPTLAGFRQGKGAVLWIAMSPGQLGYERFPYILQALTDLGVQLPFRDTRLWAFFDYSYRTRVDLDYFAARWRKAGIGALHVASWHFYDSDPERDAYLKRLIEACHREGILVYAWVELPHVSEKFWNDHPEWREKTAVLQDAHLDWRKLMNLTNRDCFRTVSLGVQNLIGRFDWDGVNLAELYFESLEGAPNPARFTPFNDTVRAQFREAAGFDPIEIYTTHKDAASLRQFLDFRAGLVKKMQEEWMAEIEKCRRVRPHLDIVLTHVDDRFDTGMKDAIGADASRVLPMLKTHDFTFLIEDPATVWNLGPQRYPEIARRYQALTPKPEKMAIDINVVDRYQDVYPTKQQTGTELFELVHLAAHAFPRVALYFENSILAPDLPLLAAASANVERVEHVGSKTIIDAPRGVGLTWSGGALVDGKAWPVHDDTTIWLPAGTHSIEPAQQSTSVRLLALNGTLRAAQSIAANKLDFAYESASRAIALLDRKPIRIETDGVSGKPEVLTGVPGQFALLLPRGQHLVSLQTE